MLISDDSPLCRLPAHLGRRELLFYDGIRHAVQIADLAYNRLCETLSPISQNDQNFTFQSSHAITSFLDSWVIVDAIDRLRGLLRLLPDEILANSAEIVRFLDESNNLRELRNVTDHLAQRADYIIANDSTALGILHWAVFRLGDNHITLFVIQPGTVANTVAKLVNPAGKMVSRGLNWITLSAGEHSVNVSDVMKSVGEVVRHIESHLVRLTSPDPQAVHGGGDMLISVEYHFSAQ